MKKLLTSDDIIFDGRMHRPFDPTIDGWKNELLDEAEFPVIGMAMDILCLVNEVNRLKKENWELRQELKK